VETIGSKRSYALIWCMPNNDDDECQKNCQHKHGLSGVTADNVRGK